MTDEYLTFIHTQAKVLSAMFDAVLESIPYSPVITRIDEALFLQELEVMKLARGEMK